MKLSDKGPIRPAPKLKQPMQSVSLAVQSWPGVISAAHWFLFDLTQVDGADFYVGGEELGHIHLDGEVHLATTPAMRNALVRRGFAQLLRYGGDTSGWVELSIASAADAALATELFRLNYLRLTGTPVADLVQAIKELALADAVS